MKSALLTVLALAAAVIPHASRADALTAQDYAEIEQLYAQYNLTLDANDPEGWAATFTPDGTFMSYTGHDGLVGFAKAWHERMGGTTRRHWNTNLRLTGDGTKAEGTVYLMLVDVATKSIYSTGVYTDVLTKTPQGWRFTKRVVKLDAAAPAAPAQQPPK
ncbi:MAG TPA: nuclear transport factor 2 family protein [Povalibacter sp.]|uniref:nuclear transport factor 2 family protein n=1 Tax=Povalibacter sp. TaxID=1962978 RepID=UPI002C91FE04|nr:nuclear transport factor 2 family protein [Povalibacter sp.]HMN47324.1 nuclear transport factor 2 family protein [Povalibacter sp.]